MDTVNKSFPKALCAHKISGIIWKNHFHRFHSLQKVPFPTSCSPLRQTWRNPNMFSYTFVIILLAQKCATRGNDVTYENLHHSKQFLRCPYGENALDPHFRFQSNTLHNYINCYSELKCIDHTSQKPMLDSWESTQLHTHPYMCIGFVCTNSQLQISGKQ